MLGFGLCIKAPSWGWWGACLMITEEHLKHWIKESRYYLGGIASEIDKKKLDGLSGMAIEKADGTKVFVSFDYIREKIIMIEGQLRCIEDDVLRD